MHIKNTEQPKMNLLDDLERQSQNNANELSSDEDGRYLPGADTDYVEKLKKEVESKVNDFSELSMKRTKRRARCTVDTYYTETFDPEPPKPKSHEPVEVPEKPKKRATRRRSFLGRII